MPSLVTETHPRSSAGTPRRFAPMLRRARRPPFAFPEPACGCPPAPRPSRPGGRCRHARRGLQRAVAVTRGILELSADLAERLALPTHLARREVPDRIARNTGGLEIGGLVTDRAAHGREAKSVGAALDRRLMQPRHIALARAVARRMAIHAARVGQHFAELGEECHRPRRGVWDRRKTVHAREAVSAAASSATARQNARS